MVFLVGIPRQKAPRSGLISRRCSGRRRRRCYLLIRSTQSAVLITHFCRRLYWRSPPTNRSQQRHGKYRLPNTRIGKFIASTRDRRTRPSRVLESRSRYEEVGRSSSKPVVTVPTRDVVNTARERIHLRAEEMTASRRS